MKTPSLPGIIIAFALIGTSVAAPRAPRQPAEGPGGRDYVAESVVETQFGSGATGYTLFTPGGTTITPAPLVVFLHGWGATSPRTYRAWIDHLVRKGNVVVYPAYQDALTTPPATITDNAEAALLAAITQLTTSTSPTVDVTRMVLVGHSAGGVVAANLAARAIGRGLPQPVGVMAVEPSKSWKVVAATRVPFEDLSTVPADTLLLTLAGSSDRVARTLDAKRIYRETTAIPAANKDFVEVVTDRYGRPNLVAGHFAPLATALGASRQGSTRRDSVNALDYYAYWKLSQALVEAATTGKNRSVALGNTPEQRYMGLWNDGTPVRELRVSDPQ